MFTLALAVFSKVSTETNKQGLFHETELIINSTNEFAHYSMIVRNVWHLWSVINQVLMGKCQQIGLQM